MDFMNSAMEYTYEYYEHQQESNNYKVEQLAYIEGYDLLDKDDWTKTASANDLENLQEIKEILEVEMESIEQELKEEE